MDDIALGYSESNVDAWSVDAELEASKKSPPRKPTTSDEQQKEVVEEEVKPAGPLQVGTHPISDFMMGLFGMTPEKEKDEKPPGGIPASIQSSLSDKMEKPNSLRSLKSVDSSDGTSSDGSMSSLSCSMHGARGKSGPASSLDRHRLEQLVSELMNHKNGDIFVSHPCTNSHFPFHHKHISTYIPCSSFSQSSRVDTNEFPDYLDVIQRPMDLGIILKKLLRSGYPTLLDFHADVSLTFDNAMTYNKAGTPVHTMAAELKELFETNFLELLDELEAELHDKEEADDRLAI